MNRREILCELEYNITRMIDLPLLLESDSKHVRKDANHTLWDVVIPNIYDVELKDSLNAFSVTDDLELYEFMTQYKNLMRARNYKAASDHATSFKRAIIYEKQNTTVCD